MKHEFISIGLDANFCDPTVLMQMETIGINHIQVLVYVLSLYYKFVCVCVRGCMRAYTIM